MSTDSINARLERCIRILLLLQLSDSYNPTQLSGMFAVSRRTVFRDIQLLRNANIPIEFNLEEGTYYIRGDFSSIRNVGLSTFDIMAIAMAVGASPISSISGFEEQLRAAWTKLITALPECDRAHAVILNPLDRAEPGEHLLANAGQVESWNVIFQAITRHERIEVVVRQSGRKRALESIVLMPESLRMRTDGWLIHGTTDGSVDIEFGLDEVVSVVCESEP